MKSEYCPPAHREDDFNCIHCGAYAHQYWYDVGRNTGAGRFQSVPILDICICHRCKELSFWHDGRMVVPAESPIEPSHPDMSADCKQFYEEARQIFSVSPRGAAALLRLSTQLLCRHLGGKGENIDEDIAQLVKDGLSPRIQTALDICRVIGNHAVHPGKIVIEENVETTRKLFGILNHIVEDRITRPKDLQDILDGLPERDKEKIKNRGNKQL